MRFWVGPWVWESTIQPNHWAMPTGSLASLDLRSIPQCEARVTPQGSAVFVTANATTLGTDYTNLGTDSNAILSNPQKAAWRTRFGLPNPLAASTLVDMVWETLTIQADPTGVNRVLPLVPSIDRQFELWIAGTRVKSKRFNLGDDEAIPVIELLKRMYRQARQNSLDGISHPQHYRKFLGALARKYGIDYRNFIPSDLPDEGELSPETTITETFNTANSSTLGPNLTWVEYTANAATDRFTIVSNTCRVIELDVDGGSSARAESDLSSADHYAQVVIAAIGSTTQNKQIGACCRFSASAQTHYLARALQTNDTFGICKIVAGTLTALGSAVSQVPAASGIVRLTCNGSSIKSTYSGVDKETITDTAITTGTRCGIFGYSANTLGDADLDSFEAGDLGVLFDATSNSGYNTADASYSWNHTCTGSNRLLLVGVSILSVAGASVSGITYNSVALSLIRARASAAGAVRSEIWGLVAPATGLNAIEVTLSAALDSIGSAVSLTRVNQSLPTEAANDASATNVGAADATVDITSVADSDLIVDNVATDDTAITVGTGQTQRTNVTGTLGSGGISTEGPKTPAGSVTMNWSAVAALATWTIVGVAVRPTEASGASSPTQPQGLHKISVGGWRQGLHPIDTGI